ncbi:formin-like protein 5 [Sorghum bicolor]|uniref:formin-like protein 5 n=1 Tax=Sorghum bicolor TaxID=4558 RepID=UPI000B425FB3|nr:formin-like protein 5 [Sorghum bicolor]|eukprot:XP_021321384.1 formin-like protein 5 [Sorghum bicolor]
MPWICYNTTQAANGPWKMTRGPISCTGYMWGRQHSTAAPSSHVDSTVAGSRHRSRQPPPPPPSRAGACPAPPPPHAATRDDDGRPRDPRARLAWCERRIVLTAEARPVGPRHSPWHGNSASSEHGPARLETDACRPAPSAAAGGGDALTLIHSAAPLPIPTRAAPPPHPRPLLRTLHQTLISAYAAAPHRPPATAHRSSSYTPASSPPPDLQAPRSSCTVLCLCRSSAPFLRRRALPQLFPVYPPLFFSISLAPGSVSEQVVGVKLVPPEALRNGADW